VRPAWIPLLVLLGLPARGGAPRLLTETGLYVRNGGLQVAPANLTFAPQYPLWSDGAAKRRWIFLPPGRTIDVRDPDAWVFPVGTRLWKEFSFNGEKVETRMLWRATAATWVFATYAWRKDGSDAVLVPPEGQPLAAEIVPGRFHDIPSLQDCASCHDNPRGPVLGFTALQLSDDRDPGALHTEPLRPGMATLGTLVARGLLHPARPDLLSDPPRIRTTSPRTRAVLGYLSANCGSCHQDGGAIPGVRLELRHPCRYLGRPPGLRSTVGQPTRAALLGPGTCAVTPGAPGSSLLLHRMATRDPIARMPPLGSVLVDHEAVALIRAWIAEMPPVRTSAD